jgi:hypothetical protein
VGVHYHETNHRTYLRRVLISDKSNVKIWEIISELEESDAVTHTLSEEEYLVGMKIGTHVDYCSTMQFITYDA